jgi:hypothetical protein
MSMGRHLASHLPYENTSIDPLTTRAEIDAMLHEFIIIDQDTGQKSTWISAIRWTDLPPQMPTLEFMVDYVMEGIKKRVAIRLQPPLLYRRVRRRQGTLNEPQPSQSMRLLYWYVKSKLEAVMFGLTDASHEFLSHVLVSLPGGRMETVGSIIIDQIKESKIPALPSKEPEPESPKVIDARGTTS